MNNATYQLIRSKRKTFGLEISENGALIVRAPMRASKRAIKQLLNKHQAWISKHQTKVLNRPKPEGIYFLGKSYQAHYCDTQQQPLIFDNAFLIRNDFKSHQTTLLAHWYKKQAEKILTERTHLIAKKHGFHYSKIKITNTKTYWGLCNKDNVLSFNWHIIKAPIETVEYLIMHELVHTKIKNHSKLFWANVKSICPDYKTHESILKNWAYGK